SDLALNDDADDSIELKLTVAENGDDEDEDNRDPNFPPETLL
ncbi:MAG: segregation and condensation protein B, partial [Zhongshania aliphaticivorans]